jgi:hypothetical protein
MGLKETWRNGSGKQKRNMVLGGVAAFLTLATIAAMITDSVRGTRSGRRKTEVEQVVTPNQRNLTQEGLAAEIYALRNQVQQMQQQIVQRQPEKGGGLTEEQVRQIVAENRNAGLESQAASAIGNGFVPPGTLPDDKGAPLAPGAGGSAQPAASAEEEDSSPYQNHTSNSSKNSGSKDKETAVRLWARKAARRTTPVVIFPPVRNCRSSPSPASTRPPATVTAKRAVRAKTPCPSCCA